MVMTDLQPFDPDVPGAKRLRDGVGGICSTRGSRRPERWGLS